MKSVSCNSPSHSLERNCRSFPQGYFDILSTFLGIIILACSMGTSRRILGNPPHEASLTADTTLETNTTYHLTFSPAALTFGNTAIGTTASLSVVVTNKGTSSVTFTRASTTNTAFTVANLSLPLTLAAGKSKSFSVDFAPAQVESYSATVNLYTSNSTAGSMSVTGTGVHWVLLSWKASTSSGVTGYDIYRSTTSGGPYTLLTTTPTPGTTYTDDTVKANTTYYYVATAVASGDQSKYSNQASVKVP